MNRPFVCTFVVALSFAAVACERSDDSANGSNGQSQPAAPDNTAQNKADRNLETKTPIDQAENKTDLTITSEIRSALVKDGFSINAQNCKVITENGVVTLRGPVDSQTEKDRIESIARNTAGVTRVNNQLEIKNP